MEFPTLISWTSQFPFYGLLDGIFHLPPKFFNKISGSKQRRTGPDAAFCGVWSGSALFADVS